jgi:peptide/nickel transport system substrate-binding protein
VVETLKKDRLMCAVSIVAVIVLFSLLPHAEGVPTPKKYGGTLVLGHQQVPNTLNTVLWSDDRAGRGPAAQIYSNLVDFDRNYLYIPGLAEKWEISSDGLTYTFYLRKNVKWHDGKPFTSADVKYTFDLIESRKGFNWDLVKDYYDKMEIVDDYTVRMTLKKPNSAILSTLCDYYTKGYVILPKHIFEGTNVEKNPAVDAPIGTGPYKFVEWIRGVQVKLVANLEYFNGRPGADYLIFKYLDSPQAITSAFEAGEIDWTREPYASETDLVRIAKEKPGVVLGFMPPHKLSHIAFNMRIPPFDKLEVRYGVAYALNITELAKYTHPTRQPNPHVYHTGHWATDPNLVQPGYDPKKAEELLDAAGYRRGADGIRFRTKIIGIAGDADVSLTSEVIKEQLSKVGIAVEIENRPFPVFTTTVIEGVKKDPKAFEMALMGGAHGPDPSQFQLFVGTDKYRNIYGFSDPRVDQLFVEGVLKQNIEDRKKVYYEIQKLVLAQLPRLNYVAADAMVIYNDQWKDYWHKIDQAPYYVFSTVYWEKGTAAVATTPVTTAVTTGKTVTTTTPTTGIETIAPAAIAVVVIAAVLVVIMRRRRPKSQ